jgi:hypothetical protein
VLPGIVLGHQHAVGWEGVRARADVELGRLRVGGRLERGEKDVAAVRLGRVVPDPGDLGDAVEPGDPIGQRRRERLAHGVGHHELGFQPVVERLVDAPVRRLADDRHRGDQGEPDHEGGCRGGGPTRIALGVLARQQADGAERPREPACDDPDDRRPDDRGEQGDAHEDGGDAGADEGARRSDLGEQADTDRHGSGRGQRRPGHAAHAQ